MTATPILVVLLSAILIKEKITWIRYAGIFLGASGAIYLIFITTKTDAHADLMGDIFVFLNAILYGLYLLLVKELMKKYNAFTIFRSIFLLGFFVVLPFGIPEMKEVSFSTFPLEVWGALFFVCICATFLTYVLNAWALRLASASLVGSYIYVQPVLASTISIGIGQDTFIIGHAISAVLIMTGVYLVGKRNKM
jgi:drug/metabolite transporter (DMT)-like permease